MDRFLIFCARLLKEKLKFVSQLFCEYKELFYFLNSFPLYLSLDLMVYRFQ